MRAHAPFAGFGWCCYRRTPCVLSAPAVEPHRVPWWPYMSASRAPVLSCINTSVRYSRGPHGLPTCTICVTAATPEEYLETNNPMSHFRGVSVPLLVVYVRWLPGRILAYASGEGGCFYGPELTQDPLAVSPFPPRLCPPPRNTRNALDDLLTPEERIPTHLLSGMGGTLLLITRQGSHCAYSEGFSGSGHYLSRVTMAFLQQAHQTGARPVNVG